MSPDKLRRVNSAASVKFFADVRQEPFYSALRG